MKKELKKFGHALRGWYLLATNDNHGRFHHIALLAVIAAGFYFKINPMEWMAIILCCAGVIGFEAINAALETLADVVQPNQDPRIKNIKDLAAGAVLICAVAATLVGLLIFVPHLLTQ